MNRLRRRLPAAFAAALVALTLGAITVFACTTLATMNTSAPAGEPGSSVTVTGEAFAPNGSPVALHWNSLNGPVVGEVQPTATGEFSANVVVPADAQPGSYAIIATQTANGHAAFGTPARVPFTVNGTAKLPAPHANGAAGHSTPATFDGSVILLGLLGLVALATLGGGAVLLRSELQRGAVARIRKKP